MAPRKPDEDGASSTDGTPIPDILKPKTEKAKVAKVKAEPKTKVKAEETKKAMRAVKSKAEKGDGTGEKKEKVAKPKTEKDGAGKVVKKADKGDGKAGEKKGGRLERRGRKMDVDEKQG